MPNAEFMSAIEASEFLRHMLFSDQLKRLAENNEIPAYKIGNDWYFKPSDLIKWVEKHKNQYKE